MKMEGGVSLSEFVVGIARKRGKTLIVTKQKSRATERALSSRRRPECAATCRRRPSEHHPVTGAQPLTPARRSTLAVAARAGCRAA